VVGYIVDHYCFLYDRGVVHIFVAGYIVEHYCLRFDRGAFILLWLVIFLTTNV
jgi:ABC-type iron transport system FetAB permease component